MPRNSGQKPRKTKALASLYPTGYNTGVMTGTDNRKGKTMTAAIDNLTNAKHLAATVGVKQFWCLQFERGRYYVVSDPYGQRGSRTRFAVTDDDAIRMAREAGVECDDEGLVA
jgi:hypothetical protein